MPLWFIALAFVAVAVVITALIQPHAKGTVPSPAELKDFSFPQDAEGTPEIVVFGDVWLDGWFVIWYGNLRTEPIKVSSSGGSKK
jgi:hypothetical protein